jgi:hypothetical protein
MLLCTSDYTNNQILTPMHLTPPHSTSPYLTPAHVHQHTNQPLTISPSLGLDLQPTSFFIPGHAPIDIYIPPTMPTIQPELGNTITGRKRPPSPSHSSTPSEDINYFPVPAHLCNILSCPKHDPNVPPTNKKTTMCPLGILLSLPRQTYFHSLRACPLLIIFTEIIFPFPLPDTVPREGVRIL